MHGCYGSELIRIKDNGDSELVHHSKSHSSVEFTLSNELILGFVPWLLLKDSRQWSMTGKVLVGFLITTA